MTGNRFRPVSVREEVYEDVSRLAKEEEKSIAEVVSDAIENYKDYRRDIRRKADRIIELLEKDTTK